MNTRLKRLRTNLKLSQKDFGSKINLSPDMISLLETGKRNFTERVTSDICRVFNVNRNWFENGKGNMFVATPSNLEEYIETRVEYKSIKVVFEQILELDLIKDVNKLKFPVQEGTIEEVLIKALKTDLAHLISKRENQKNKKNS